MKKCKECKEELQKKSRNNKIFCNRNCQSNFKRKEKRGPFAEKNCRECGVLFVPEKTSKQVFCQKRCLKKYHNKAYRDYKKLCNANNVKQNLKKQATVASIAQ